MRLMHLIGMMACASLLASPTLSFSIGGDDDEPGSGGDSTEPTTEPQPEPAVNDDAGESTNETTEDQDGAESGDSADEPDEPDAA
jgi:hypothetical protein